MDAFVCPCVEDNQMVLRIVEQIFRTAFDKVFLPASPGVLDLIDGRAAFDLLAQLCRTGDHVERQSIINVFVRGRGPLEITGI